MTSALNTEQAMQGFGATGGGAGTMMGMQQAPAANQYTGAANLNG